MEGGPGMIPPGTLPSGISECADLFLYKSPGLKLRYFCLYRKAQTSLGPPLSQFFLATRQGYLLRLMVVPGANRTAVVGLLGDRLKIRLAAPPERGAANRELLAFLARELKLPKTALRLAAGSQSRAKVVEVLGLDPELWPRLQGLLPPP
jgi:uncharacterized protein (TIGR00251 family)